jgi:alanine racemase
MIDSSAPDMVRTSAHIDLDALEENYRSIAALVSPATRLLCVVKANAYGHGALGVASKLASMGVRHFAVATIEEGRELREKGIPGLILVLSGIMPWEDVAPVVDYDLTPVVAGFDLLDRLLSFKGARPVGVHLKIDTGMGRLGFGAGEIETLARRIRDAGKTGDGSGMRVEGMMSHFASSDKRDEYGFGQVQAFRAALASLKEKGIEPEFLHMANSAAICNFPEAHFNMVRPGIMLYGSYPDRSLRSGIALKPLMRWTSRVAFTRLFDPRSSLSYGRTFVTERETRVAYVPIGYADGFPRSLSNRGSVLIRGTRCPVIGTVCMEWILADVTRLGDAGAGDGVRAGEEVVIMGRDGNEIITADEIAERTGTIPYEILCGVSRRVPRHHA